MIDYVVFPEDIGPLDQRYILAWKLYVIDKHNLFVDEDGNRWFAKKKTTVIRLPGDETS